MATSFEHFKELVHAHVDPPAAQGIRCKSSDMNSEDKEMAERAEAKMAALAAHAAAETNVEA